MARYGAECMAGCAKACIAEVRWRWPIQAEKSVEMEWEGGMPSDCGVNERVEWVRVVYLWCHRVFGIW